MSIAAAAAQPHPGMGFKQFVAFVAAVMATNALAIDAMLPALPDIARSFGLADELQSQWVLTAYLLGFGAAQIVYGTLSDRYGRKPVLLFGLALYVVAAVATFFAPDFGSMIVARVVQGIGAAATRVLAVSIVRDCYSGRRMAQVMSLAMIVFLAVPVLAPSVGQVVILVAPWRWIFGVLAAFGSAVLLWAAWRMPETLHPEDRRPISLHNIVEAFHTVLSNRIAVGYMLAMTVVLGGLFGFLNSAQPIFAQAFGVPHLFTTIFAGIAMSMALASLTNARLVGRIGSRRISHVALLGFIALACLHVVIGSTAGETLWVFVVVQAAMMFCFGLVAPNFNAMAMEPMGHVAGTASSVMGFVSTVGAALLGFWLGQRFDGTTLPLGQGMAALGLVALVLVILAERGRLFRPHERVVPGLPG
ncbi:MAG TPA: multidrug effflux MFS transporter [Geminicoccaceae bacterium]|nr:multidrug effflux MFS transporter [Geminicoccus sp.]HMU52830.1 multidrug effflux MFS transporter [Geminicoccaceae bacterium]